MARPEVWVTFVTDEQGAIVFAETRGRPPRFARATRSFAGEQWSCQLALEIGRPYRIRVLVDERRATGPATIVPYEGIDALKYSFHAGARRIGGEEGADERQREQWTPPEDIQSFDAQFYAALAAIVFLLLAVVGAVVLIVWFSRKPSSLVYTVCANQLAPPDDWPHELTWTHRNMIPVGKIASGGLACVYLVQDARYGGAYMALKLLHEQFCSDSEVDLKARFLDEPAIMGHLAKTGYVPLVYGRSKAAFSRPWFTMDYLDGMFPMRRMVGGRGHYRIDPSLLLPMMLEITKAIRAIHAHGVVHRDLSPENLMIGVNGNLRVKVIDFGGAKFRNRVFAKEDFFHGVTPPGVQMGKIHYTAPEIWRDGIHAADDTSDGYSVAAMFWEMATGRTPYSGGIAGEIRQNQARGTLPVADLYKSGVPKAVAELLCTMLMPEQYYRASLYVLEAELAPYVGRSTCY